MAALGGSTEFTCFTAATAATEHGRLDGLAGQAFGVAVPEVAPKARPNGQASNTMPCPPCWLPWLYCLQLVRRAFTGTFRHGHPDRRKRMINRTLSAVAGSLGLVLLCGCGGGAGSSSTSALRMISRPSGLAYHKFRQRHAARPEAMSMNCIRSSRTLTHREPRAAQGGELRVYLRGWS